MLRQAEFQQIPQPDGRLLSERFQFLFGQRFWIEEHPGLRVFAAFVIDAPPLTAAGNLQLAQMAVPPITTSFLAPADHMIADAAFRPFKIEQSFTLLFQQVRPLVPVGKPQTMRHNGLTHANGPIGRLAFTLVSFSEFLQLREQGQLFLCDFHTLPPMCYSFISDWPPCSSAGLFPKVLVKHS